MTARVRTLILGAGPTGLGAAWRLQQEPRSDWLLLEADETAEAGRARQALGDGGDLGREVWVDGDGAGEAAEAGGLRRCRRDGTFVPHPRQYALSFT